MNAAIVDFYRELVPDANFPINEELIVTEGFPKFEETIGKANFAKVKKFFGIGVKKSTTIQRKEINILVDKLRTVENAQYYIDGYKAMVEDVARKLNGAPDTMSALEKAKLIRLYLTVFTGYGYFVEDCRRAYSAENKAQIYVLDYDLALKNNSRRLYPEEFYGQYLERVKSVQDETLFYECILFEIEHVLSEDKKVFKELMKFAELSYENGSFVSVNAISEFRTFGSVRTLKLKVHKEFGIFPVELFGFWSQASDLRFEDMYVIHKVFTLHDLSELETVEEPCKIVQGSRIVEQTRTCYVLDENFEIGGELEKQRFVNLYELLVREGKSLKGCDDNDPNRYDMSLYDATIKFLYACGYADDDSVPEMDTVLAKKLVAEDKDGVLYRYRDGEVSELEAKELIGIDSDFELRVFGIENPEEKQEKLKSAIRTVAVKLGYAESEDEVDDVLLENVIIPENENVWESFVSGEISEKKLPRAIGITKELEEFSKMFFSIKQIDGSAIEDKLMDIKKSQRKNLKQYRLLVKLYCYLVESEIKCGPTRRVCKRNRSLKPSILNKLCA